MYLSDMYINVNLLMHQQLVTHFSRSRRRTVQAKKNISLFHHMCMQKMVIDTHIGMAFNFEIYSKDEAEIGMVKDISLTFYIIVYFIKLHNGWHGRR